MSQLPPVVIVRKDDTGKRLFLGATGWTAHRAGALSFETDVQAREWITNAPTALVSGASVANVAHEIENPGQPAHVSDYDPLEVA